MNLITVPSQSLLLWDMQFLLENVLSAERISAQSLGLVCITAALDINHQCLNSLELILPFLKSEDPKLRSSVSKVWIQLCLV